MVRAISPGDGFGRAPRTPRESTLSVTDGMLVNQKIQLLSNPTWGLSGRLTEEQIYALATGPGTPDAAVNAAMSMVGSEDVLAIAEQLRNTDPFVQGAQWGQFTPGQQQALRSVGYSPPDLSNVGGGGGWFSNIQVPGSGALRGLIDAIPIDSVLGVETPWSRWAKNEGNLEIDITPTGVMNFANPLTYVGLSVGTALRGALWAFEGGERHMTRMWRTGQLWAAQVDQALGISEDSGRFGTMGMSGDWWDPRTVYRAWNIAEVGEKLFTDEAINEASQALGGSVAEMGDMSSDLWLAARVAGGYSEPEIVREMGYTESDPEWTDKLLEVHARMGAMGDPDGSFAQAVYILDKGKVSFGRDIARAFQLDDSDSGIYQALNPVIEAGTDALPVIPRVDAHKAVSGVADAAYMVFMDPTLFAGKTVKGVRGLYAIQALRVLGDEGRYLAHLDDFVRWMDRTGETITPEAMRQFQADIGVTISGNPLAKAITNHRDLRGIRRIQRFNDAFAGAMRDHDLVERLQDLTSYAAGDTERAGDALASFRSMMDDWPTSAADKAADPELTNLLRQIKKDLTRKANGNPATKLDEHLAEAQRILHRRLVHFRRRHREVIPMYDAARAHHKQMKASSTATLAKAEETSLLPMAKGLDDPLGIWDFYAASDRWKAIFGSNATGINAGFMQLPRVTFTRERVEDAKDWMYKALDPGKGGDALVGEYHAKFAQLFWELEKDAVLAGAAALDPEDALRVRNTLAQQSLADARELLESLPKVRVLTRSEDEIRTRYLELLEQYGLDELGNWHRTTDVGFVSRRIRDAGHEDLARWVSMVGRPGQHLRRFTRSMFHQAWGGGPLHLKGDRAVAEFEKLVNAGALAHLPQQYMDEMLGMFLTGNEAVRAQLGLILTNDVLFRSGFLTRASASSQEVWERFVRHSHQAYGLNGTDRVSVAGTPTKYALYTNPAKGTQYEDMIMMPSFTDLARMTRNVNIYRSMFMGVSHAPVLDAWMNRVWKPAQLLRIGFIPRAAGEEIIAFGLRRSFSEYLLQRVADRHAGIRRFTAGDRAGMVYRPGEHYESLILRPFTLFSHTSRRLLGLTDGQIWAKAGRKLYDDPNFHTWSPDEVARRLDDEVKNYFVQRPVASLVPAMDRYLHELSLKTGSYFHELGARTVKMTRDDLAQWTLERFSSDEGRQARKAARASQMNPALAQADAEIAGAIAAGYDNLSAGAAVVTKTVPFQKPDGSLMYIPMRVQLSKFHMVTPENTEEYARGFAMKLEQMLADPAARTMLMDSLNYVGDESMATTVAALYEALGWQQGDPREMITELIRWVENEGGFKAQPWLHEALLGWLDEGVWPGGVGRAEVPVGSVPPTVLDDPLYDLDNAPDVFLPADDLAAIEAFEDLVPDVARQRADKAWVRGRINADYAAPAPRRRRGVEEYETDIRIHLADDASRTTVGEIHERTGLTPQQMSAGQTSYDDARRRARAEAKDLADQLGAELESWDATSLGRPDASSQWEWYWALDRSDQQMLIRRGYVTKPERVRGQASDDAGGFLNDPNKMGMNPEQLADAMYRQGRLSDPTHIETALGVWLDTIRRREDATNFARTGKLPTRVTVDELAPGVSMEMDHMPWGLDAIFKEGRPRHEGWAMMAENDLVSARLTADQADEVADVEVLDHIISHWADDMPPALRESYGRWAATDGPNLPSAPASGLDVPWMLQRMGFDVKSPSSSLNAGADDVVKEATILDEMSLEAAYWMAQQGRRAYANIPRQTMVEDIVGRVMPDDEVFDLSYARLEDVAEDTDMWAHYVDAVGGGDEMVAIGPYTRDIDWVKRLRERDPDRFPADQEPAEILRDIFAGRYADDGWVIGPQARETVTRRIVDDLDDEAVRDLYTRMFAPDEGFPPEVAGIMDDVTDAEMFDVLAEMWRTRQFSPEVMDRLDEALGGRTAARFVNPRNEAQLARRAHLEEVAARTGPRTESVFVASRSNAVTREDVLNGIRDPRLRAAVAELTTPGKYQHSVLYRLLGGRTHADHLIWTPEELFERLVFRNERELLATRNVGQMRSSVIANTNGQQPIAMPPRTHDVPLVAPMVHRSDWRLLAGLSNPEEAQRFIDEFLRPQFGDNLPPHFWENLAEAAHRGITDELYWTEFGAHVEMQAIASQDFVPFTAFTTSDPVIARAFGEALEQYRRSKAGDTTDIHGVLRANRPDGPSLARPSNQRIARIDVPESVIESQADGFRNLTGRPRSPHEKPVDYYGVAPYQTLHATEIVDEVAYVRARRARTSATEKPGDYEWITEDKLYRTPYRLDEEPRDRVMPNKRTPAYMPDEGHEAMRLLEAAFIGKHGELVGDADELIAGLRAAVDGIDAHMADVIGFVHRALADAGGLRTQRQLVKRIHELATQTTDAAEAARLQMLVRALSKHRFFGGARGMPTDEALAMRDQLTDIHRLEEELVTGAFDDLYHFRNEVVALADELDSAGMNYELDAMGRSATVGSGVTHEAGAKMLAERMATDFMENMTTFGLNRAGDTPRADVLAEVIFPSLHRPEMAATPAEILNRVEGMANLPQAVPALRWMSVQDTMWDTLVRLGFDTVITPAIKSLARTPHYRANLAVAMDQLEPFLRSMSGPVGRRLEDALDGTDHTMDLLDDLLSNIWAQAIMREEASMLPSMLSPEGYEAYRALVRAIEDGNVSAFDEVYEMVDHAPLLTAMEYRYVEAAGGNRGEGIRNMLADMKARHQHLEDYHHMVNERAVALTTPFIDDHRIRSQFQQLVSSLVPFWFAEEQFLKRWIIGSYQTPHALRKGQIVMSGFRELGMIRDDQYGEEVFVFPGSEQVNALLGPVLANRFGGANIGNVFHNPMTTRTEYMFPGLRSNPGTAEYGPTLAVGLNLLANSFPEFSDLRDEVLGDLNANRFGPNTGFVPEVLDLVMPASVGALVRSMVFNDFDEGSLRSAEIQAASYLMAEGFDPGPDASPEELQDWQDQVNGVARTILALRAWSGFIGGASGMVDAVHTEVSEEFRMLLNEAVPMPDAVSAMIEKHGGWVTPYTAFSSGSASGAPIPSTEASLGWMRSNTGFVEAYPMVAPWFLPQERPQGDYGIAERRARSEAIYRELRTLDTPAEFTRQIYFQAAAEPYFERQERYRERRLVLKGSGQDDLVDQLDQEWQIWSESWKLQHPIFAADMQAGTARSRREQILTQMKDVLAAPEMIPEVDHRDDLLTMMRVLLDFDTRMTALQGIQSGEATEARRRLREQLYATTYREAQAKPVLMPFFSSVIRPILGGEEIARIEYENPSLATA